jgi:hypothetical protein
MTIEENHLLRIDQVWMAVSVDEKGCEGVCAMYDPVVGSWMPLVAADPERLADINRMAAALAVQRGQLIKIIKLTTREEVDSWDGRN